MLELRVMIVEDSPETIQLLERRLQKACALLKTLTFQNARAAIAYLQDPRLKEKELPNLAVLDLGLPDGSGIDVLESFRANPLLRDIPVVVYSASESPEDLKNVYKKGATVFVQKSSDESIIETVIAQLRTTGRLQ